MQPLGRRRRALLRALALTFLALSELATSSAAQTTIIDDFEDVSAWVPVAADGVSVDLSSGDGVAGRALRFDFDFHGGAGYAIARRPVALTLPPSYRLRLWLRAQGADGGLAPVNDLELKFVGASGDDVWWHNRRRFAYPSDWTPLTTKARHVEFAWGPAGGGPPTDLSAIEIAVTAQEGGAGTVWIDSLTVEAVPDAGPYTGTPTATASAGRDADGALDGDAATAWTAPGPATLSADFGRERELGGLTLDWGEAHAADYDVQTSDDGERWTPRYQARGSDGGRDYIPMPDTDVRFVRLVALSAPDGLALRELTVEPLDFAATPNDLYRRIAADAPRGHYPRYLVGEASYWTVVGADGDEEEALLSEDGAIEVGNGAFSIEPFVLHDGRLISWADADAAVHGLYGDGLPIPSLSIQTDRVSLDMSAWVAGQDSSATLNVTYRVGHVPTGSRRDPGELGRDSFQLALVLRPLLVNPSYQFLSAPSGVSSIERIERDGDLISVDGWNVRPSRSPQRVAMSTFDGGGVVGRLASGPLAERAMIEDPNGGAEAVLVFDVPSRSTPTHTTSDRLGVTLQIPMVRTTRLPEPGPLPTQEEEMLVGTVPLSPLQQAERAWSRRLGGAESFRIQGAPEAEALGAAARAQIGYVLVNRDGPAVQPGSRAYDRSWIRDGALTSAALLRVGVDVATDFARWYAPFQYANGKVPCCVDPRGADPVPEHDSHGQLIYLAAETFRYTGDRAFLREMWPSVRGAVAFMDSIRASTRTPAFDTDSTRHLRGLMPPSISHEGYAAKPAYSYWDDLFALRGYRDAVFIAETLGEPTAALVASRDAFEADFAASARATLAYHDLATLPGAADLGDFDATSTSVALDPVSAGNVLPDAALRATFEQYWDNFEERRTTDEWEAYTPYEWRNVGAMLRLGEAERAHTAIDWFMQHRRPTGWQHWAEVVWRDERDPRFIGDMPHTWVGSDMLRATLDLFGYTDGAPGAERLVVGAGIPMRWTQWVSGVAVTGLVTPGGALTYRASRAVRNGVAYVFTSLPDVPPGGIVVRAPFDGTFVRAEVDGEPVDFADGAVVLRAPAERVTFLSD